MLRLFSDILFLILLTIGFMQMARGEGNTYEKPNIIFIIADDVSWDDIRVLWQSGGKDADY